MVLFLFFQQPSTGLDPVASRLMWRLLSRISASKTTAVVLTTHNMLECEAVCTRICIMKLGTLLRDCVLCSVLLFCQFQALFYSLKAHDYRILVNVSYIGYFCIAFV